MKKYLSIALLILVNCFAADSQQLLPAPNSVNGTTITPETQLSLMPKLPYKKLFDLLHKEGILTPADPGDKNQTNFLRYNEEKFVTKISGKINRNITAIHTLKDDAGKIWSEKGYYTKQLQYLEANPVDTYQTASRGAYYLVTNKAIMKHNLNQMSVATTYLYTTDGSSKIDDTRAVIVQNYVPGKKLEDRLDEGYEVSGNQLKQFFSLTELIGLWSLRKNVIVDPKNRLVPIDLEQPNNTRAQDHFHKAAYRRHGNAVCGIKDELFVIFKDDQESKRALVTLVQESDIINSDGFNKEYKREILNFVKQYEDK